MEKIAIATFCYGERYHNQVNRMISEINSCDFKPTIVVVTDDVTKILDKPFVKTYDILEFNPEYKNYNNSYHSTIHDKPINIHKRGKKNRKQVKLIANLKDELLKSNISYPALKIGDKVRLHILTKKETRKDIFRKKYVPQWSKKIYTVRYVVGDKSGKIKPKYEIVDGNKIIGTYYRHDLQLIS